jgi:soluble lytic murein transglycosylase-like protein
MGIFDFLRRRPGASAALGLAAAAVAGRACERPHRIGWRDELASAPPDAWRKHAPAWAEPLIVGAAAEAGIPPALLAALVRTESAYQPQVVSHAGAIGLAQLMPNTAAQLGVDPYQPAENVKGGARYLREQLDAFDSVRLALAAYNAGPHRVRQYGGIPPFRETRAYVDRIMGRIFEVA